MPNPLAAVKLGFLGAQWAKTIGMVIGGILALCIILGGLYYLLTEFGAQKVKIEELEATGAKQSEIIEYQQDYMERHDERTVEVEREKQEFRDDKHNFWLEHGHGPGRSHYDSWADSPIPWPDRDPVDDDTEPVAEAEEESDERQWWEIR